MTRRTLKTLNLKPQHPARLTAFALAMGATALPAAAADVTVYGLIDLGINVGRIDNGTETTTKTEMASGSQAMSRFGIKGSEVLSDDLTVAFVLENGFDADTGALKSNLNGALFGREAVIELRSKTWGTFKAGRVGALLSGYNSTGLFGGKVSPFSTTWNYSPGHKTVMTGDFLPYDNMLVYVTPSFAGWRLHAQHSLSTAQQKAADAKLEEGTPDVDRYGALAVTHTGERHYAVLVLDTLDYGKKMRGDVKDAWHVSLGGNVDFDAVKVYAAAQYFEGSQALGVKELNPTGALLGAGTDNADGIKGYGLNLGVDLRALGGTVKLNTGWMDAENEKARTRDIKRWTATVGYDKPLSKRTKVYVSGGFQLDQYGVKGADDGKQLGAIAGMIHSF